MLVMALDHANHFVAHKHPSGEHWGGNFPTYQDGFTFLTRLVTHLAAPGFFFLMGVGIFLFSQSRRDKGWNVWRIMRYFLTRGGVLILLQLLVVNPAWKLGSGTFPDVYIGVLIALGGTMILASSLLRLKPGWWLFLALTLFIGMELLHPNPEQWGLDNPIGLFTLYSGGDLSLWSNYPLLPWFELVLLGMFFGYWLSKNFLQSVRSAAWIGFLFLVIFSILRILDGFGNIRPMKGDSWIDFFNVVKYPPSMTFTLLTMGVNLLLLSGLGQLEKKWPQLLKILAVFGREPLFFYVVHLYLYLGLGKMLLPNGSSIAAMYPVWILGLGILYMLCLAYARYKRRHKDMAIFRFL